MIKHDYLNITHLNRVFGFVSVSPHESLTKVTGILKRKPLFWANSSCSGSYRCLSFLFFFGLYNYRTAGSTSVDTLYDSMERGRGGGEEEVMLYNWWW